MKKVFVSLSLIVACVIGVSAQNGNSNLEVIAKKAATDAGCITQGAGGLNFSTSFLGTCSSDIATTSAWSEVMILPKVNPNEAPYVRIAPLAFVTICGNEVLSVECGL